MGDAEPVDMPLGTLGDPGLLESADAGEGWRWRVQVIRAGLSKNRNLYPMEVLRRRVGLYEGVPVFAGRGPDHNPHERGFGSNVGWIRSPSLNADGIEAVFEVRRDREDIRAALLHGWQTQQETGRPAFGFSHVLAPGRFASRITRVAEGAVRRIEDFDAVESVDLVMRPSAGGALIGLAAAVGRDEELETMDELLERLRRGEALTPDERAALMAAVTAKDFFEAEQAGAAARAAAEPADPVTPQPAQAAPEPELVGAAAAEAIAQRLQIMEGRAMLAEALTEAKLPPILADTIRQDLTAQAATRPLTRAEIDARIARDRSLWAKIAEAERPAGPSGITVGADERDKRQAALDGLFLGQPVDGVPPYRSLRQAYLDISGTTMDPLDSRLPFAILAEAVTFVPDDMRLTESVTTSTWAAMLGDSMTRRMIREYAAPAFSSWRAITGPSVPLSDFRTQRRVRVGGYGDLPKVNEAGTYQPLGTPSDQEASYQPAKFGGLEDLTLETIANDDIGAVRQIPIKLGRAAARTLYHAVWNGVILANPNTTYDNQPLFSSAHGNTGTLALNDAGLFAVETAMRRQSAFGHPDEVLGEANMPVTLVVPTGLRRVASDLTNSPVAVIPAANATMPNPYQGRYQIIVIDDWTDQNDWYAFADPMSVPILEIGFLNGREEPELFVQDQPTTGSVFTADKITYKIRHIWGIGILDHRGAYRQVVAD